MIEIISITLIVCLASCVKALPNYNKVDILAAVFATYPDIQDKFPQFADKILAADRDTAAFSSHSNADSINLLVSKLEDDLKARGVSDAQINQFRTDLSVNLQGNVGWNSPVESAWTQGLDNVFRLLFAAL